MIGMELTCFAKRKVIYLEPIGPGVGDASNAVE